MLKRKAPEKTNLGEKWLKCNFFIPIFKMGSFKAAGEVESAHLHCALLQRGRLSCACFICDFTSQTVEYEWVYLSVLKRFPIYWTWLTVFLSFCSSIQAQTKDWHDPGCITLAQRRLSFTSFIVKISKSIPFHRSSSWLVLPPFILCHNSRILDPGMEH